MAINAKKQVTSAALNSSSLLSKQMRRLLLIGTTTLFATLIAMAYLMPLGYAAAVALRGTTVDADAPLWPAAPAQFTYEGQSYDIYKVPLDGEVKRMAIIKKGREKSTLIDPANPSQPIEWTGRWRTLERVWAFSPSW